MYRFAPFEKTLLAFFIFIGSLICIRIFFTGSLHFIFLVWNLFLAWIPFRLSFYLIRIINIKKWKQLLLLAGWLLFFPNALYIITDLIHLGLESKVPKWFDAVLIFSASVVGLMMAFISLYRVELFLEKNIHKKRVPIVIIFILFLGSFGVYLGRFLRWNSWDIISNPLDLLLTVVQRFVFPLDHLQTWGITSVLTVLFYLLYFSIKKLPGYIFPHQGSDGSKPSDSVKNPTRVPHTKRVFL